MADPTVAIAHGLYESSPGESRDLEVSPANAVNFMPMKLNLPQNTVRQPDSSDSFQLPPAAWTVGFAEVTPGADPGTDRNDLNLGDPSNKLKLHWL